MSTYHMASLHSKQSKNMTLPLGGRWGVPEGTSVADCLAWNWVNPEKTRCEHLQQQQKQYQPQIRFEQINGDNGEVCEDELLHVESVPCDEPSPIVRAAAPTPQLMERPRTQQSYRDENHIDTTEEIIRTGRNITTPPSFREVIKPTQRVITKQNNNGEIMTFREFMKQREMEKNSRYPHYKPNEEDVEYVIKQTKSLRVRTPTASRSASNINRSSKTGREVYSAARSQTPGLGSRPPFKVGAARSPFNAFNNPTPRVPSFGRSSGYRSELLRSRTPKEEQHEKALIASMRKELTSQSRECPSCQDGINGVALLNKDPMNNQTNTIIKRPNSTSQIELVRNKKTVGFMDENDYHNYLSYLEDKHGCGRNTPGKKSHFNTWRATTAKIARPKKSGRLSADTPNKINVAMDCPDNSDMQISVRVKSTPITAY